MGLNKSLSGGTYNLKRIFTARKLSAQLIQSISDDDFAKLCGDDTLFDNVQVDSNYFALDGASNFYYAVKDFSFLIQWSGWTWFSAGTVEKVYVSALKLGSTDKIMQQIASVDNVDTGQNFQRYHYNLYPFQAFENHFIGFLIRNPTARNLILSNTATSQPDYEWNLSIDLVSE